MRWTEEEYQAYLARQRNVRRPDNVLGQESKPEGRSKYAAEKRKVDGITFHSQKEARYYENNKLRIAAANDPLAFQLLQVPFYLGAGIRYRLDVLEFETYDPENGLWRLDFVDVKGFITDKYLMKKKLVEDRYPIKITEK